MMHNQHGDFIWYELLTSDAEATQEFYGPLLGWRFADKRPVYHRDYRIIHTDDGIAGGIMTISEAMKQGGGRPVWLGYIAVDDVDRSVESIVKAGGSLHMPPTDVADVGRLAMLTDPQGAPFYVMRGSSDQVSSAFAYDKPRAGHCAWNELVTSDRSAAMDFYTTQFGWRKDGELDMGPMGAYEFVRRADVAGMFGAVMTKPQEIPRSIWTYYFRVTDIDETVTRIKADGGKIVNGPQEIPGGEFVVNAVDPQGAQFAAIGARI